MEIFNSIRDININERTAVALGNFDGIHIGHRVVLEKAIEIAHVNGLKSVCYTFSNHPFNYIMNRDENDSEGIKLICTESQKIAMLEKMGFDILVNVPFDEQTMTMPAEEFIDAILVSRLHSAAVSVGFNYRFGSRAAGTTELLIEAGREYSRIPCCANNVNHVQDCNNKESHLCVGNSGFSVFVHDAVTVNGEIVSSTLIREKLAAGDMKAVRALLGRDYCLSGVVEHGRKIGTGLGFPTANLSAPTDRVMLPNGVYFGHVVLDGKNYNCITNIGVKPTVTDEGRRTIESHIFDYEGSCYGKTIVVFFEQFRRPEMRFADIDALHDQIAVDYKAATEYFE